MLVIQLLRRWEDLISPDLVLAAGDQQPSSVAVVALPLLQGMALALPLVLFIFGASQWILAKEAESRALRRQALRNGLLLGLIAWPVGTAGPMWLGLAFATAAGLFLLAAFPKRGRSMFSEHP